MAVHKQMPANVNKLEGRGKQLVQDSSTIKRDTVDNDYANLLLLLMFLLVLLMHFAQKQFDNY